MTVPVVKEHKKIMDEIDDAYSASIRAATGLRTFMVRPKGKANTREYFLAFYHAFFGMYMHTRSLPGMEHFKRKEELERWFKVRGEITHQRIDTGLDLFAEYQHEILTNSIVSVTR